MHMGPVDTALTGLLLPDKYHSSALPLMAVAASTSIGCLDPALRPIRWSWISFFKKIYLVIGGAGWLEEKGTYPEGPEKP